MYTSRKHSYISITPLNPILYSKTWVYIIFLILLDCGYSLELRRPGGSNANTHNLCFEQKYEKYQNVFFI